MPKPIDRKHDTLLMERIQLPETLERVRTLYAFDFSQMISLHFRVGDYKFLPNHHPVLPLSYYTSALNVMMRMTPARTVLYFYEAGDKAHVDQYIGLLKPLFPHMTFVSMDLTVPDYEQLALMACCSHQIIANSTFSWWGAWFAHAAGARWATYPSSMGQGQPEPVDLFPEWGDVIKS